MTQLSDDLDIRLILRTKLMLNVELKTLDYFLCALHIIWAIGAQFPKIALIPEYL